MISGLVHSGAPARLATALLILGLLASLATLAPSPAQAGTGLSWRDLETGSDAQFRGLAPVSRHVAWVSGTEGTVLRTTDGGRTLEGRLAGRRHRPPRSSATSRRGTPSTR